MLADEVYMEEMVKQLEGISDEADFMPMIEGLMQSLLNKDLIYEPLVNMSEAYPKYLEENKDKISKEDLGRYEEQLKYCKLIIAEYDAVDSDESVPGKEQAMTEEQLSKVLDLVSKV